MEFRYPNITGTTEKEMLLQIKSYLNQLVPQLEFALSTVSSGSNGGAMVIQQSNVPTSSSQKIDAEATFNDIKALIIKSADIVEAYYDEIMTKLEGEYLAESDFGTFVQNTTNTIESNSMNITQNYEHFQSLISDINTTINSIDTRAYIKSGHLGFEDNGVPIFGIEIGQRDNVEDEELSRRFARFTADKLSFFDQNGDEVAYISSTELVITNARIKYSYTIGGFVDEVGQNGDVVTKWIGYDGGEG